MTAQLATGSPAKSGTTNVIEEQLYCALTGKPVRADEAYWAPPLVTVRELLSTLMTTLFHTPSNLKHILVGEQPNVPYAPEVREQLASRRSQEQAKLLGLMLVVAALIFAPIFLLAIR